jgi:hypothetical protein
MPDPDEQTAPATGQPLTQPVAESDPPAGDMQSVTASLRELRGKLGQGATPLELDVPGYEGLLVVRYRWVPFDQISKNSEALKKIGNQSALAVAACAETLLTTCQEFLIRTEDGELQPLSQTDVPITFSDKRLAEALGFDPSLGVREYVKATFNNDYAVIDQANTVMEWLQDTSKGVNKNFLGK